MATDVCCVTIRPGQTRRAAPPPFPPPGKNVSPFARTECEINQMLYVIMKSCVCGIFLQGREGEGEGLRYSESLVIWPKSSRFYGVHVRCMVCILHGTCARDGSHIMCISLLRRACVLFLVSYNPIPCQISSRTNVWKGRNVRFGHKYIT